MLGQKAPQIRSASIVKADLKVQGKKILGASYFSFRICPFIKETIRKG
jgi:hypothetical protein